MKMGCFSITHQTVWRFVSFTVIMVSLLGECAVNRGTSCPVYQDLEWQKRDGKCDRGKKYHCFENERANVESDGCFLEKTCARGAHPVVDFNHIRCAYCQTGFQRQEKLRSSTYTFSFCERHSAPCKAEYGQTQCRAGTREWDRACTCNASLGFFPRIDGEDCDCFTPNDACSGCKFRGCLNGTVKNSRGVCRPTPMEILIHTTPPGSHTETPSAFSTTARAHDDSAELQGGEIAGIVIAIIFVVTVIALLACCACKKRCKRDSQGNSGALLACCACKKRCKRDSQGNSGDVKPENRNRTAPVDTHDSKKPMIPRNGNHCSIEEEDEKVTPQDSLHSKTPRGNKQNRVYYVEYGVLQVPENATINVVKTKDLHIGSGHIVAASSYQLDPSSTPLMGRDPPTLQRTPDARNPSTSRCDPLPVTVSSSALPSTETPCEGDQLLPTPQSAPVPADLPATYSSLPGPAPLPPLSETSASPPSIPNPSAPPPSILDPSAPPPSILDPSAPPPSILDPSAPPPSILDPSAPPPSILDPSAPPPSILDPSAPPPSILDPSAPPPSILDPSAPLPSLPDPTAPLPFLHVVDQSLTEDEGNPGEVQRSDDDETQRKLPYISHHSEAGEVCQSEVDETSKKLPYSSLDSVVDVASPLSSSFDQGTPCNETMETAFSGQQSVNGKAGPVSVTRCGDGALPGRMKPVYSTGIHTDEEVTNLRSCRTDDKSRMSGSQAHAGTVYSQVTDDDSADVMLNVIA